MITLKGYQEKAVEHLIEDTYTLLKTPGGRLKMVLKAPTGAGKTVTMSSYLNKLCEEIPDKLDIPIQKIAFIWIAPNQLHLQSFNSLKNYFEELRSIKPIQFDDITNNKLNPNEVLFLNWQSVNKDSNLFVKENEQDKTLITYVKNARLDDTEIIMILDEAHLFASKGKSAQDLLQLIYAKIEIDVSATPLFSSDYGYTIKRPEVVIAQMIKQGVLLNPALDSHLQQNKTLNQVLLEQALKKREELALFYKDTGSKVNPLLLIQLPNDTKTESQEDIKIKEEVEKYLRIIGISTNNHRLGIWLSNEKTNLNNIEDFESITDVLLFKQAISLGWDCPRAAVLLIYREIKQEVFTIQTVGRILRMPERRFYTNVILNYGYVYTNLSKDIIKVVRDDMDYIVQNQANRIKNYQPIGLTSYFINTRLIRNRLSSKFRLCLYESAETYFKLTTNIEKAGVKGLTIYNIEKLQEISLEIDIENIEIPIPRDVEITGEEGIKKVDVLERFAKTQSELDIIFRRFCRNHVGGYAKLDSTPVLELALKMFFFDYFGIDEFRAIKIILFEKNVQKFIEVIDRALEKHEQLLLEKETETSKLIEENIWEVPVQRIYNEYFFERKVNHHVLEPFYEYQLARNPEKNFVFFLEQNGNHIEWWYKNGDKNKEDFAITYIDRYGVLRGFFIDFVIKLTQGPIALFDTKTLDSDPEFCNKHNALIEYVQQKSTEQQVFFGGVIVPVGNDVERVWKYSPNKITNPTEAKGWISFDPSMI